MNPNKFICLFISPNYSAILLASCGGLNERDFHGLKFLNVDPQLVELFGKE